MDAQRLQYLMEHGNLDRGRCIQIAKSAEAAITIHSQSRSMQQLAQAMFQCCGSNPDEAAFYRAAVDFVLEEKWKANPKDIAVLITAMDQQYALLSRSGGSIEPVRANHVGDAGGKPKAGGCLIILGFFGLVSVGVALLKPWIT